MGERENLSKTQREEPLRRKTPSESLLPGMDRRALGCPVCRHEILSKNVHQLKVVAVVVGGR